MSRLLVAVAIVLIALVVPGFFIYQGAKSVSAHAKALSAAYKAENLDQMVTETRATKGALSQVDMSMNFLFWTGLIPFVGGYWQDAKGFTHAGVQEFTALDTILTNLQPSKDELGFNGQPHAGQDRIAQGIKVLDKTMPLLDKVQGNLKNASDSVKNIDTNKYPDKFRNFQVKKNLQIAKDFIMGANVAVTQARPALQIAPKALGEPNARNYLLLFQNDKEIRATGGFMTAYAFLKIDRGQISNTSSDDIYRLDEKLLNVCQSKICPLAPPAPIVRYLPEVSGKPRTAWSMRDSNLSPDIPTSAQTFENMYKLLGQGLPFDGIIFIDTQVVENLIEITGPIEVYGTKYSAETDSRCNCSNVIYELESYAEIAAKGTQDRKAILGVLMEQVLARSLGADNAKLPVLIQTLATLANEKHIIFYMHDQDTEDALASLNWTGQIKNYDGDYLHINDSNFAGGKSNLYVNQTVIQDIKVQNGKVTKKVTIEYKNPQPFNIWLNGINRDYVRLYVPKGSQLVSSKGSDDPVKTSEDLGKTVFEAFVSIRPQNSRTLAFEYTVPYTPKGKYNLMIQKQPGAKDFQYKVNINGRQVEKFNLDADKEFHVGI